MSKHMIKAIKEKIAEYQADMRRLATADNLPESLEQDYQARIRKLETALANEK